MLGPFMPLYFRFGGNLPSLENSGLLCEGRRGVGVGGGACGGPGAVGLDTGQGRATVLRCLDQIWSEELEEAPPNPFCCPHSMAVTCFPPV